MRLSVLFALTTTFAVALSPLACGGADAEEDLNTPAPDDSEDELKSMSLTEADNGKTVNVAKGQSVIVKLAGKPTAGYKWQVTKTDRTFGYPTETYVSDSAAVGSGGVQKFTWKGNSFFDLTGAHTVTLEYKRAWEKKAPEKTFTFTVNVLAAATAPAKCGPLMITCASGTHSTTAGCVLPRQARCVPN